MNKFRHLFELVLSILLYIVVLVFSLRYLKNNQLDDSTQMIVTLLPVIPCVFVCWSVIRQLSQLDEMQHRIQLQAFGIAFVGTALITFSYGFLENIGFPLLSMFFVWPLMATLWGMGIAIGSWRYR
ncbi:hypothetical protein F938_01123 [Acinetobacter bereziniae LMG 1003 = CIP 70.12]|uniref:Uncharacterized protein n=1 Tax=Acinetobacter bereziniae LMG 1003 = CIP 70.12 TaxID=981324 RepID=N9ETK7_ACIBZ|nr:hypothetical protein [Acinetobacter bereziniae]ENV98269.1 hypothetical protein F938_01123 [Acinetobacter bereziniae LMG 1003 = CIP 70.12]